MQDEQTRQVRVLIVAAMVICAAIIGYNAFYVPDAPLSEPVMTADASSQSEEYTPSSAAVSLPLRSSGVSAQTASKVNINTATAQELNTRLKGIGEGLAGRIVAYREQHGPFASVEQIKNVEGIGEKKFEQIRGSITVG